MMKAHAMTGQACVDVRPTMRAFAGAEVAEQALALPTLGLHIHLTLFIPDNRDDGQCCFSSVRSPADAGQTIMSDISSMRKS